IPWSEWYFLFVQALTFLDDLKHVQAAEMTCKAVRNLTAQSLVWAQLYERRMAQWPGAPNPALPLIITGYRGVVAKARPHEMEARLHELLRQGLQVRHPREWKWLVKRRLAEVEVVAERPVRMTVWRGHAPAFEPADVVTGPCDSASTTNDLRT